jgi:hypothetical protein
MILFMGPLSGVRRLLTVSRATMPPYGVSHPHPIVMNCGGTERPCGGPFHGTVPGDALTISECRERIVELSAVEPHGAGERSEVAS